MVGIRIARTLTHLSERVLNIWYAVAVLSAIPGMVLYLQASLWWAPLLTLAALLSFGVGVLGFFNRHRLLDKIASAGLVFFAIILGVLAVVGWVFVALEATA